MAAKLADHLAYAPRLMRAERAAAYLDISLSTFQRLVDEGVLPRPVRKLAAGCVVWDRLSLDTACDGLAADAEAENTAHALLRRKP